MKSYGGSKSKRNIDSFARMGKKPQSPVFSVILFDCQTSSRIVSTKRFTISLIICFLNRLNDSFDASKFLFVSLIAAVNVIN